MFGNYIQNIYTEFGACMNPHKIGASKLSSVSLSKYIPDTCKYLQVAKDRFVFKQDFSGVETITFENCYCENCSLILWTLPSIKYKTYISSEIDYTNKVYSTIVNNAVILLNINQIYLNNCGLNEYIKFLCLACCFVINKHHILRTNGTFYCDISINEFLLNCLANFKERYQDKEQFNIDLMTTTRKNTEYVYKTTNRVTFGYADKGRRHSLSMKKFNATEEDYVLKLMDSKISLREIKKQYEKKFNKSISLGKLSSIYKIWTVISQL